MSQNEDGTEQQLNLFRKASGRTAAQDNEGPVANPYSEENMSNIPDAEPTNVEHRTGPAPPRHTGETGK